MTHIERSLKPRRRPYPASLACTLLAWLRVLALDGNLAKAEPKALR